MRLVKLLYLNITFYAFFIIFSLAAIPLLSFFIVLCAVVLPRRRMMRRLRRAISWYGAVIIYVLPFPLVRIRCRRDTRGDPGGPYIFVCNHRAASDAFLLAVLPLEAIQVVNIWPFRLPVLGAIAKIAGYLSVREIPFTDFAARAGKLLKEGVSVAVFPEGTRSRDSSLGQFHGAMFRVALETRSPIVPVCITGNENIPPVGSAFLHPGVIKIHLLKPVLWEEYGGMSPFQLKNHLRALIGAEVAVMEKSG